MRERDTKTETGRRRRKDLYKDIDREGDREEDEAERLNEIKMEERKKKKRKIDRERLAGNRWASLEELDRECEMR